MKDSKDRTFLTRLLFIRDIFTDKYDQAEILTSSINFKLKMSYESYLAALKSSSEIISYKDPLKILKKIDND